MSNINASSETSSESTPVDLSIPREILANPALALQFDWQAWFEGRNLHLDLLVAVERQQQLLQRAHLLWRELTMDLGYDDKSPVDELMDTFKDLLKDPKRVTGYLKRLIDILAERAQPLYHRKDLRVKANDAINNFRDHSPSWGATSRPWYPIKEYPCKNQGCKTSYWWSPKESDRRCFQCGFLGVE